MTIARSFEDHPGRKRRFLIAVALLCLSSLAYGHEVTLYWYASGGGLGFVVRRPWFVDGVKFVEIKGGERVTIDLPRGKHTFRNQENTESSRVFDVAGPLILKFGNSFTEALVDQDPLLRQELDATSPIMPIAFVPK